MNEHVVASITQTAWSVFGSKDNSEAFLDAWLTVQCQMIPLARQSWLFLYSANDAQLELQATYPSATVPVANKFISDTARQVLDGKEGIVEPAEGEDGFILAYPILDGERAVAVVVLKLPKDAEQSLASAMRQLQWGSAWVLDWIHRQDRFHSIEGAHDLPEIFSLFAATVEPESFGHASTALTTRVATLLGFERVSLGLKRNYTIHIASVSGVAQSNPKLEILTKIKGAMNEAVDQKQCIFWPERRLGEAAITRKHQALLNEQCNGAVATFPLGNETSIYGALTIEKGSSFTQRELDISEAIAALVGPVLREKRKNDRWLPVKILDTCRSQLAKLFGTKYPVRKFLLLAAVMIVTAAVFVKTPHEISAPAVIEPAKRRVIVAPFDGYLLESFVRPGDKVKKDDVLAALDNSELLLERIKLRADRTERTLKYQEATAKYELATAKVLKAEVDQIDAELLSVEMKLNRARITAPMDGIVITGDLSKSIGEPVNVGKQLLELAPINAYRMIVKVDERNITYIEEGQTGRAILAALPDRGIDIVVKRLTPILQAEGGRNYYRVEAEFDGTIDGIRPGLEGRARVVGAERSLFWIWTHDLVRWVKLQAWAWLP